jgi:cytochrome c-type protein NapB
VGRKLAVVAAIAAFTAGLSGFFMGLLQTDQTAARLREETQAILVTTAPAALLQVGQAAPVAPSYTEIAGRTRQPNHGWRSQLASLRRPPAFTADSPRLAPEEVAALSARRLSRRAFNGAPPTVPHPIDQHQSTSCLACHGQPTRIGMVDVPQMSHAAYTHCIQCHAPAHGPGGEFNRTVLPLATPSLGNAFSGLPPPVGGTRAYPSAPPTIPHPTAMRQNCVSCHGPGGSSLVRTTHPQRQNCLQCHALDATRETLPLQLLARKSET